MAGISSSYPNQSPNSGCQGHWQAGHSSGDHGRIEPLLGHSRIDVDQNDPTHSEVLFFLNRSGTEGFAMFFGVFNLPWWGDVPSSWS